MVALVGRVAVEGGALSTTRWLAGRIAQAVLTFVLACAAAFLLMRLAPGDPVPPDVEQRAVSADEIAELRARYGLDQPIARQFVVFMLGAVRGDLGTSIQFGRPVRALLTERLVASLLLGGTVLVVNFTLGIWLGVRQAAAAGQPVDGLLGLAGATSIALPSFWVGLLLVWAFGLHGPRLPVAGMRDPLLASPGALAAALDVARHLVLPALTLSLVTIGATMRYQRAAMLDVLVQPFVRTARMKGLAASAVTWRHAWRAALAPMLTLLGLWLPLLVTGSVFVEAVFAWPGLGGLAAQAAALRDYPLMMGCTLLVAFLVVLGSLLADLACAAADPRLRQA